MIPFQLIDFRICTHSRRLSMAAALVFALGACGKNPDPQDPDPGPVDPNHNMTINQAYPLSPNDRLVNTQLEPVRVQIVFELDEASEQTRADVTLLEGNADLFQ